MKYSYYTIRIITIKISKEIIISSKFYRDSSIVKHLKGLNRNWQPTHWASKLSPYILVYAIKAVNIANSSYHSWCANILCAYWTFPFRISCWLFNGSTNFYFLFTNFHLSLHVSITKIPVQDLMSHQHYQNTRLLKQLKNRILPFPLWRFMSQVNPVKLIP